MRSDDVPAAATRRPNDPGTVLGRDELNLAEFPLASLADRVPSGSKTLVFEDSIWDKGLKREITRRLTITGSNQYGLPTALDDEVILGLIQVTKEVGFASRVVGFSRYRLIRLLGWRAEGRSYRRLDESLKRWLGVTLYYDNAWWNKQEQKWVDAHFHLLEYVTLSHGPQRPRRSDPAAGAGNYGGRPDGYDALGSPGQGSQGGESGHETASSFFSWNPIVFRSFQAGYLKQLDLEVYRRLQLPTSKRMYRFLDKKFHFSRVLRFDLRRFACEHIGLSRSHDAAQLRRKLAPAVAELEQQGLVAPLPSGERFRQLSRGVWEVVFLKPRARNSTVPRQIASDALAGELIRRGVTQSAAVKLAQDYEESVIREKMNIFDRLASRRDPRVSKNPAGYLVQSIRDDYQPPTAVRPALSRTAARTQDAPVKQPRRRQTVWRDETSEVKRYLARLSLDEIVALEAEAVAAAPVIMADGYHRAQQQGNQRLFEEYREQILNRHIVSLLAARQEKVNPARA